MSLTDKDGNIAYHVRFDKLPKDQPEVRGDEIHHASPFKVNDKFYVLNKDGGEAGVLALFTGNWRVEEGEAILIASVNQYRTGLNGEWNTMEALVALPVGTVIEIGERRDNHFIEITASGPKCYGFWEFKNRKPRPVAPVHVEAAAAPTLISANGNGAKASANGATATAKVDYTTPVVLAAGQLIEVSGVQAVVLLIDGQLQVNCI